MYAHPLTPWEALTQRWCTPTSTWKALTHGLEPLTLQVFPASSPAALKIAGAALKMAGACVAVHLLLEQLAVRALEIGGNHRPAPRESADFPRLSRAPRGG